MNKLRDILRDPIWQFVGVVISVVGILVTVTPKPQDASKPGSLTLGKYQIFSLLPGSMIGTEQDDKLKVFFDKEEIPKAQLRVAQYYLQNETNRPIEARDFAEPLRAHFSKDVTPIYIKTVRQDATSAVGTSWEKQGNGDYVMAPTLVNAGEALWIQIVYRRTSEARDDDSLPTSWTALVRGVKFEVLSKLPEAGQPSWYLFKIDHEGIAVYLLVASGLVLSSLMFLLIGPVVWHRYTPKKASVALALVSGLLWGVSEIAVDVLVNRNYAQAWISWVFLGTLVLLTAVTLKAYIQMPRSGSSGSVPPDAQ